MIKFIVAPPGSGKTLVIVQRDVVNALKSKKKVYHNIRGLNPVKLAYYCGLYVEDVEASLEYMYSPFILKYIKDKDLQSEAAKLGIDDFEEKYAKELVPVFRSAVPEILESIAQKPKDYLIVLDEAQNFIPATDYKEPKNIKFFEYATVHRHLGHDLILATQHEDNVDVKMRRIANLLIYMYRRDILGWFFRNTVTEKHYAGCATGNPELLNKFVTKYDTRVFKLYRSYISSDIKETRKYRSIWRNGTLIFLCVVLILCLTRVPGFLRKWGVIKPKAVTPVEFIGEHEDYYCGKSLYVYRKDGKIDVILPSKENPIPLSVCPHQNYSPKHKLNEVSK